MEDKALAEFVGTDAQQARQAFDRLEPQARAYLRAYLGRATGLTPEQREDVIQDTLLRFWSVRRAYRNDGAIAWRGWLKATARRVCIDLYRRTVTQIPVDSQVQEETLADPDETPAEALMSLLDAEQLLHQADLLWLGLDPSLSPAQHTRRLLAAQMLYWDRLPWETVCRLLARAHPQDRPLTRADLDSWLADPGVLRHLAFHVLRYGNDRLAGHLLGLPDPPDPQTLDALGRCPAPCAPPDAAPGEACWSAEEVAVILWRYRYALLADQILRRDDCALDADALPALLDRTRRCFPFSAEMTRLLSVLGPSGHTALRHRGLWQRLAFAYRYTDRLPHQDIQDRTQPAYAHVADPAQPEITLGMLNVWLSNGRLLTALARACREGNGDDNEGNGDG